MADQQQQRAPLIRNNLVRIDILHKLGDDELIKTYCLNDARVFFVTGHNYEGHPAYDVKRSQALTEEVKVIIILCFFATGKMLLCNSDSISVSQSTVSPNT